MVGLACAAAAVLGLLTGRDPLLALGLTTPRFVAYPGASAEQVRFVMDDGWSQTAAVPGALLIDWREGQAQPGVNPGVIEMEYVGATELTVDQAGRLHIRSSGGEWIDGTPESWQDGPSGRVPVASSFELRGGNRFGFVVGPYDPSRPLVVDPPSERSR
jgi:hypothetical protein